MDLEADAEEVLRLLGQAGRPVVRRTLLELFHTIRAVRRAGRPASARLLPGGPQASETSDSLVFGRNVGRGRAC